MATDYSSENPHSQLAKLRAEQPHVQRITEAASMWSTAQQRIGAARDELATRADALESSWTDEAGRDFGARVEQSTNSLKAWHDKIAGSGIIGQANALQLDFPNCLAQVQAVCARFDAAVQAQQAGGGGGDTAAMERQYAQEAARYTNHIAALMERVAAALNGLAGGGPAWAGPGATEAGPGGSSGGQSSGGPGEGAPQAGGQPPGGAQQPQQGGQGQGQGQQGQRGGGQDPLQQGMAAGQQAVGQIGQLAQQLGGAGMPDAATDPSLLDPTRSGEFPDRAGLNGLPELSGIGAGAVGGAGAGGGMSPVAHAPNLGASAPPTGAAPGLPGLAGAPAAGAATAGTGGMGGMAPMMPMHGAQGGLGAAGGVRPGDAERNGNGRSRERQAGVAGVPATLRGRSSGAAQSGTVSQASARRREERANDAGEVLDEELWHVAGQDHKRADTRGTLRSKR